MKNGNKANGLAVLRDNGFNVPQYIVLGKDFFMDFLKEVGAYETAQLTYMKRAWLSQGFKEIRGKIIEAPISELMVERIYNAVSGMNFPIAVRSSASVEDSDKNSAAGLFKTHLFVEKGKLVEKIRDIMASLYSENCVIALPEQDFHPDQYYMGVVLQEMVTPQWSGVVFSADPLTGDPSELLVEMARGVGEGIVSGLVDTQSFSLRRTGDLAEVDAERRRILLELREAAIRAEKLIKKPVDIEWAYRDGIIYFLQCRPITTLKCKPDLPEIKYFSMSKLGPETYPLLGFLQKRYTKWLKKARFFEFCEQNAIETNKWKLLVFSKSTLKKFDFSALFSDFKSPYVFYHLNNHATACTHIRNIPKILDDFTRLYKDSQYCVSFREYLLNERAAISSVNENGWIQIECISGKMSHLNAGMMVPSRYLLNENNVLMESILAEQAICRFNEKTMEMEPSGLRAVISLSDQQLQEIAVKTRLFAAHFGPSAVEWWIWGETLYAADMAILKTEGIGKNNTIISKGRVRGRLYSIQQISEVVAGQLSLYSSISVADANYEFNEVDKIREMKEYLHSLSVHNKVIIYSDRPYIFLASIKNLASGFVFKNASSLCHLSLILRESGIPALSLNGTEPANYHDGLNIELDAEEGALRYL